jgi:hypothetical protein
MLKMVMEDMPADEVALLYQEGNDAVVLIARHLSDDERCAAVNKLLGRLNVRVTPARFPVPLAAPQEGTAHACGGSPAALGLAH